MTSALDLRSRARGTLLGVLVGDALGMGYEGLPPAEVPEKIVMRDVRLGRGTYTDDTQMTMVLAESLLRCNLVDEDDLGTSFAAAHDPERGYGAGTTHVLDLIRHGQTPAKAARLVFNGRGSVGNGAAMRVAPVAIRFHEDSVLLDTQARSSARVTHAHRVGIDAAAVQAAAVAASLNGEEPLAAATAAAQTDELAAALHTAARRCALGLDPERIAPDDRGVPALAAPSVAAAVVIATRTSSFEEAVLLAIRAGGDTDTVACMAGAVAGARYGEDAIPAEWLDQVENESRGRDHLRQLADQLAERATSRPTWVREPAVE